jgi:hypothetical protein
VIPAKSTDALIASPARPFNDAPEGKSISRWDLVSAMEHNSFMHPECEVNDYRTGVYAAAEHRTGRVIQRTQDTESARYTYKIKRKSSLRRIHIKFGITFSHDSI